MPEPTKEKLKGLLSAQMDDFNEAQARAEAAEALNTRYRLALSFYANRSDDGSTAREALSPPADSQEQGGEDG